MKGIFIPLKFKIQSELLATFEVIYDKDFAAKLLLAFDKVIINEAFDELELIADDLEDASTSAILDSIWDDIYKILLMIKKHTSQN